MAKKIIKKMPKKRLPEESIELPPEAPRKLKLIATMEELEAVLRREEKERKIKEQLQAELKQDIEKAQKIEDSLSQDIADAEEKAEERELEERRKRATEATVAILYAEYERSTRKLVAKIQKQLRYGTVKTGDDYAAVLAEQLKKQVYQGEGGTFREEKELLKNALVDVGKPARGEKLDALHAELEEKLGMLLRGHVNPEQFESRVLKPHEESVHKEVFSGIRKRKPLERP